MNISSVVISARPDRAAEVRARLAALPGVEIHGESPEGKLVITLEDTDVCTAADSYVALHEVPGVLCATLVYQYGDDPMPVSPTSAFDPAPHQHSVTPGAA